jgi:hypothetical protein
MLKLSGGYTCKPIEAPELINLSAKAAFVAAQRNDRTQKVALNIYCNFNTIN